MEYNPKIQQKNKFTSLSSSASTSQPNIEYSRLLQLLKAQNNQKEDLRKESFYNQTDLSNSEDNSVSKISSESLIPVPGMLIEYENSESGYSSPTSNWEAPHGPQWGPALR